MTSKLHPGRILTGSSKIYNKLLKYSLRAFCFLQVFFFLSSLTENGLCIHNHTHDEKPGNGMYDITNKLLNAKTFNIVTCCSAKANYTWEICISRYDLNTRIKNGSIPTTLCYLCCLKPREAGGYCRLGQRSKTRAQEQKAQTFCHTTLQFQARNSLAPCLYSRNIQFSMLLRELELIQRPVIAFVWGFFWILSSLQL